MSLYFPNANRNPSLTIRSFVLAITPDLSTTESTLSCTPPRIGSKTMEQPWEASLSTVVRLTGALMLTSSLNFTPTALKMAVARSVCGKCLARAPSPCAANWRSSDTSAVLCVLKRPSRLILGSNLWLLDATVMQATPRHWRRGSCNSYESLGFGV